MNPYRSYRETQAVGMPRIERVLALYDGAIERIECALRETEGARVTALLERARLIVSGLASGIDAEGGEVAQNLLRLCEFVLHALSGKEPPRLRDALEVLRTLRSAYAAIRPEALDLERRGLVPPVEESTAIHVTA